MAVVPGGVDATNLCAVLRAKDDLVMVSVCVVGVASLPFVAAGTTSCTQASKWR